MSSVNVMNHATVMVAVATCMTKVQVTGQLAKYKMEYESFLQFLAKSNTRVEKSFLLRVKICTKVQKANRMLPYSLHCK